MEMAIGKVYLDLSESLICNSSSEVTVSNIITITRDGKVIGKLDAKLDFSELAPELHEDAIGLLCGMSLNYHLPPTLSRYTSSKSLDDKLVREGIIGKIKKFFMG